MTSETDPTAHVAQIVPATEAEGPGRRLAVWFQGCPLRCPGCCNPEIHPVRRRRASGGSPTSSPTSSGRRDEFGVEGITLLGGEPFAHAAAAAALATAARQRGLTVMVFSGYTLEEIRGAARPGRRPTCSAHTDILVDGPYVRDQPDAERRWVGSTNQRIHFLTDRYRADDPCWRQPNTLEIRVGPDGDVTVNGFPAAGGGRTLEAAPDRSGWPRVDERRPDPATARHPVRGQPAPAAALRGPAASGRAGVAAGAAEADPAQVPAGRTPCIW